jgi:hypothetical protein
LRIDVATESVNTIKEVFDTLKSSVADLYGSVDAVVQASVLESGRFIDQALAIAQSTGYLPESKTLSEAIESAKKGLETQTYTSAFEQQRDRLVLAGKLDKLRGFADSQLTEAEKMLQVAKDQLDKLDQQIELAKSQLDTMRGVDTSIKSMAEALANFSIAAQAEKAVTSSAGGAARVAMSETPFNGVDVSKLASSGTVAEKVDFYRAARASGYEDSQIREAVEARVGSQTNNDWNYLRLASTGVIPGYAMGGMHSGGLRIVGEEGYELEATGPARYYSHSKTKDLLSGSGSSSEKESPATATEIRALRAEFRAQMRAMIQSQKTLTKLAERWDVEGLPAERVVN